MWGIGSLVGPFLTQPFLGPEDENVMNSTLTTLAYDTYTGQAFIDESRIEIPFIITGVISFAVAVVALVYQFMDLPKGLTLTIPPRESLGDVISPSKWVNGSAIVGISLVILMTFFYFTIGGREFITTTWFYSYGLDSKLAMSQQQAILLDGLNKGCYMVGRCLAIFAAKILSPQMIMHTSVYASAVFSLGLAVFGNNGITVFFVLSCIMNFFTAPIWPGLITLLDKYIVVGAIVINFTIIGGGLAGVFFQWACGWLFTYREPESIMYLILLCSTIMTVAMILIQLLATYKIGLRFIDPVPEELIMDEIMGNVDKTLPQCDVNEKEYHKESTCDYKNNIFLYNENKALTPLLHL